MAIERWLSTAMRCTLAVTALLVFLSLLEIQVSLFQETHLLTTLYTLSAAAGLLSMLLAGIAIGAIAGSHRTTPCVGKQPTISAQQMVGYIPPSAESADAMQLKAALQAGGRLEPCKCSVCLEQV